MVARGRGTILLVVAAAFGFDWIERKSSENFLHSGNSAHRRPNLPGDDTPCLREDFAAGVPSIFPVVFVSKLF